MTLLLLIAALSQPSVELHATPDMDGRCLLRAVNTTLYVVDEDTRVIRHYQDELIRVAKPKLALETFVQIGRHKVRLEPIAFDNPYFTVMAIKREIDIWNSPSRKHEGEMLDAITVNFAGMIDLGGEGRPVEFPLPWQHEYELTAWKNPVYQK